MNKSISFKRSPVYSLQIAIFAILLSIPFTFGGCVASKMVPFDAMAFSKGQTIKNAAVELIGMSTNDYSASEGRVNEFQHMVDTQIETETARGEKNQKSVDMWKLLMNPNQNLMGGFLKRWKDKGKLSSTFVNEIKPLVSRNIDKILSLESKKKGGPGN